MSPLDKTKVSGVQIHGSIHHFTRKAGGLTKCRRWAYVNQNSLLIFPDAYTSSHCYRVHLSGADVSISYEDEDNPLIAITERNNHVTYLIQPEKPYKFQKWLSAIHKASRSQFEGSNANNIMNIGRKVSSSTVNGEVYRPPDATDLNMQPERTKRQAALPVRNHIDQPIPIPTRQVQHTTDPPAVPKRIALPWDRKSNPRGYPDEQDNQWTAEQPIPPVRSSRRVPLNQMDIDVPPPRPPRANLPLKTVKEHPTMRDSEVAPTKSLDEVKSRYPVTGLAKRMSISASDLLGKSRDELILLLLQLNREKANLQRWHDYFTQQIEIVRKSRRDSTGVQKDIEAIEAELQDVNSQLSLSEPLVTFLSNMLRMGDLYGGDDVLFASEYRQHLLPAHEVVPPKPSLTLAREVEAREIARSLNASKRKMPAQTKSSAISSTMTDASCTLANWIAQSDHAEQIPEIRPRNAGQNRSSRTLKDVSSYEQESASMRIRRQQLEAELANLEEICAPHTEIHQRLRETQRSLRNKEQNKVREIPSSFSHTSGPSAALLRRLRAEQNLNNRRVATDSLRARSRWDQDYDRQALDWLDAYRSPSASLRRKGDDSGRTTPRRRNQSASGQPHRFTPISGSGDDYARADSVRRYRSIPDHLNLLSPDNEAGLNELPRQKSYEWEPLNRPLHTPKLLRESSNKFSALQPEVFMSPMQKDWFFQSNYSNRASGRDNERFRDLTPRLDNYGRETGPLDYKVAHRNTFSDRLSREWNQSFQESNANSGRQNSNRPTSDSMPSQRSISGYSNLRIDHTPNVDLMDNRDIPLVVRAYSSTTNELRANHSSPDLVRARGLMSFDKLEDNLSPSDGRPIQYKQISKPWEPRGDDLALVYIDRTADYSPSRWSEQGYKDFGQPRSSSRLTKRNPRNSEPSERRADSLDTVKTESTTKDFSRDAQTPMQQAERSIGEWLQTESLPIARGSLVHEDKSSGTAKLPKAPQFMDDQFLAGAQSSDRWPSPEIRRGKTADIDQPVKPRRRRSGQEYLLAAESIESMFSPPEPMKISERYVPSPPLVEPLDTQYQQNKEVRLNAIREVLLRQRFSGDFGRESSPPQRHSLQKEDRLNQNTHLISMQERIAKDAVASVLQLAGSRVQAGK